MILAADKVLSVADAIPILGGLVTLLVGHFLNERRNRRQARQQVLQRRREKHQSYVEELEEKVQWWRERAQSYRSEAQALRALVQPRNSLHVARTDDTPFKYGED